MQEWGHLLCKLQSPPGLALAHLLQVGEQMTDAFLFQPVPQSSLIVCQKAVGCQNAFELLAQDIDDHVAGAVGADIVDGNLAIGEDPQPSRQGPDVPTRLVCMHHAALTDQLDQSFIHGSGHASQFAIGAAPATATDLQAEAVVQRFTHFGIRNTQTMLEIARQRLGARPNHHSPSRSRGVRNWIGMPRSHSFSAMTAITTVGQKVRDHRLHFRKVNLKLLMLPSLPQPPATLRAAGQFRHLRLVHFFQTRLGVLHKTALSHFPPRMLRMLHPMPPCKRRRLSLAGAFRRRSCHFAILSLPLEKAQPVFAVVHSVSATLHFARATVLSAVGAVHYQPVPGPTAVSVLQVRFDPIPS